MNKELLESVSKQAIELGDFEFQMKDTSSMWIGSEPATDDRIDDLQQRLGVSLPADYITFLGITNGFPAPCYTEPTFMKCNEVDYLRNIDAELIDIWRETGNGDTADLLHRSICIGGKDEEQYFLLIPPTDAEEHWQYWKFASWIPGEEAFENLENYFEYIESFMIESNNADNASPRAIAQTYLSYLSDGNLDAILVLFHEQGIVKSPVYGTMDCTSFYKQLFADTQNSQIELVGVFEDYDTGNIAIHFNYRWTLKNETKVDFEVVDIIEFDEKMKIKKLTIIYDTVQSRPLVDNL